MARITGPYTIDCSLFSTAPQSIWTDNCPCPYGDRCPHLICPFPDRAKSEPLKHEYDRLRKLFASHPGRRHLSLPSVELTYDNLASILSTGNLRGTTCDKVLLNGACRYGSSCFKAHANCPYLHSIRDVIYIFRASVICDFYRYAILEGNRVPNPALSLRGYSEFFCQNRNNHSHPEKYDCLFSVVLMSHENNSLIYPLCNIYCQYCKKSTTQSIYK
jgi:hypothetical protein